MNKKQTASLLKEASNEIQRLRQSNTLMQARLDVFDKMMDLFSANPHRGQNGLCCPDIMYELAHAAERLENEAVPDKMSNIQGVKEGIQ